MTPTLAVDEHHLTSRETVDDHRGPRLVQAFERRNGDGFGPGIIRSSPPDARHWTQFYCTAYRWGVSIDEPWPPVESISHRLPAVQALDMGRVSFGPMSRFEVLGSMAGWAWRRWRCAHRSISSLNSKGRIAAGPWAVAAPGPSRRYSPPMVVFASAPVPGHPLPLNDAPPGSAKLPTVHMIGPIAFRGVRHRPRPRFGSQHAAHGGFQLDGVAKGHARLESSRR